MKPTPRKIHENHLARPATGTGWEIWATSPGSPRLVRTAEVLPADDKNLRVIGLPVHHVLGFARWLQTADETLLPAMVPTLLDRHGLIPRHAGGQPLHWTPLLREETRTLVVIRILAGQVPESFCPGRHETYECSADLLDLPENGLVLWRENGRLAAAFTRLGQGVHLQSFSESVINPEIATELLCTQLELETEQIIPRLEHVELRGDFSDEERQALAGILGFPLVTQDPGAPVIPPKPSPLLPALVATIRQKAKRRQTIERALLGVAAVYALLLLALILNVAWLTFQNSRLRKQIAASRSTVEAIRSTAQRWRALEPAINPAIYPLEVLFQSSGLLPADGVRFTLFEQRQNSVTIRGEANDAAAAFKLVEDIKGKVELNWFDWEMPRPNILPNDKAEFQIQGTPPDAPVN